MHVYKDNDKLILIIYIDDGLVISKNNTKIENLLDTKKLLVVFYFSLSWPVIAYVVGVVSQYAQNPTKAHWNTVKRIKYLKVASKYRILLDSHSDLRILAYSDADLG